MPGIKFNTTHQKKVLADNKLCNFSVCSSIRIVAQYNIPVVLVNQWRKLFPEAVFGQRRDNINWLLLYGMYKTQSPGMQGNTPPEAATWITVFIIAHNRAV